MTDAVLTSKRGTVLVITMNRPDKHNAVNGEMIEGLTAAMRELEEDDSLHIGVLHGAGGSFSSGMDLDYFASLSGGDFASDGITGLTDRADESKLLIGAVEGYAVAGGFEMALCCDLLVASTSAQFALPEVRHGIVATAGGLFRLPRRIPSQIALELALTGSRLPAVRAEALGLVNRLVEPGTAVEAALDLAAVIDANSLAAVRATKLILLQSRLMTDEVAFAAQHPVALPIQSSAEAKAGARSFRSRKSTAPAIDESAATEVVAGGTGSA